MESICYVHFKAEVWATNLVGIHGERAEWVECWIGDFILAHVEVDILVTTPSSILQRPLASASFRARSKFSSFFPVPFCPVKNRV